MITEYCHNVEMKALATKYEKELQSLREKLQHSRQWQSTIYQLQDANANLLARLNARKQRRRKKPAKKPRASVASRQVAVCPTHLL